MEPNEEASMKTATLFRSICLLGASLSLSASADTWLTNVSERNLEAQIYVDKGFKCQMFHKVNGVGKWEPMEGVMEKVPLPNHETIQFRVLDMAAGTADDQAAQIYLADASTKEKVLDLGSIRLHAKPGKDGKIACQLWYVVGMAGSKPLIKVDPIYDSKGDRIGSEHMTLMPGKSSAQ
jgi:hypothetical protein